MADRRILIVDDDADIRSLIEVLLQERGYDTIQAASGPQAIGALRTSDQRPDLVLLDIQMPGIDGWETYEMIRESIEEPVPIIFCTAKGSQVDRRRASDLGCAGFLTKPFRIGEIEDAVEKIVGAPAPT